MTVLPSTRKIFCVGGGKTGTTSLGAALQSLGFDVAEQAPFEQLIEQWAQRDFRPIIEYCKRWEAFQDIPFCLDHTFVALDHAFPQARFILTVRGSSAEWYESLVRFHTRLFGNRRLPTASEMKAFGYRHKGWLWRAHQLIYGVDEKSVFDREIYVAGYEAHNRSVMDYFRHRPGDLLVLNVGRPDAMDSLCRFLGVERNGRQMPHLNSSRKAA
ncbi:MAG TPA: sulfotransferase [Lacipirellula sp.]